MKKVLVVFISIIGLGTLAHADNQLRAVNQLPSVMVSSIPAVSGAAATVTIPQTTGFGTFSTGYNNYLASVHIDDRNTGGVATQIGVAANCTLTASGPNAPVNITYAFLGAATTGQMNIVNENFSSPVFLSTGTATLTCPATANTLWNIHLGYIVAP